ncbi:MAG: hypothetical protein HYV41_00515, partial [Candidatus Magasanikbacteria bacterium]|nr:hypothetical protein [Candidatus Magasanikbacteria bacterium]
YIAAQTISTNFPTTGGVYDTTHNGGNEDIIISKLTSDLTTLSASTFLGSDSSDISPIIMSNADTIFIVGKTASSSFPTTLGAYDTSYNGGGDVFISKISSNLQNLLSSTFLGGTTGDTPTAAVLDTSQNVYIVGQPGTNFPTTTGAYDIAGDSGDGFISKLSSDFTSLVASTYLGTSGTDSIEDITINSSGNIIVSGGTSSNDFPTTVGAYDTTKNGGGYNAFITKLDSNLTSILNSTYLGGTGDFFPLETQIALDSIDRIYILGHTASTDFPTSSGAYDTSHNGSDDLFVCQFNSSLTTLSAGTYLGGSNYDSSTDLIINTSNLFLTGRTVSTNFPITVGAYDTSHNNSNDIIVAKFVINSSPTLTLSTPSQTSSSTVTVSTTIADTDNNITSLTVEHSTNGTTWTSSTLGTVTPSEGAVSTLVGQISGIDTDLDGSVHLSIIWNIETDLPNTSTSTVYLRFTPNDGTENGSIATSSVFAIDTADPSVPGNLTVHTLTSSTIMFGLPSVTSTDTNFSEYKIHYDTSASVSTGDTAFTSSSDVNLSTSTFGGATTSNVFSGLTPNKLSTTTYAAIPTNLASASITATQATLSWNANSNPLGTQYYLASDPGGTLNSGWITDTSYSITGLSCGTSYGFHVKARNSASIETNTWSDTLSVLTASCGAGIPAPVAPVPPPPELLPIELVEPELDLCPIDTTNPVCIKPEENQPTGLISITNGSTVLQFTNQKNIVLKLDARYADKIALTESDGSASQNFDGVSFESISANKSWTLSGADGKKCVNARFLNTLKGFSYTTYACVTLDTIKPLAPTISLANSGVVDGKIVSKPSLSGTTSEPYLKIIITKTATGKLALSADTTFYTVSNAEGDWNYHFASYFEVGSYILAVKAEDQAGNMSDVERVEMIIPNTTKIPFEKPVTTEEKLPLVRRTQVPVEVRPVESPAYTDITVSNTTLSGDSTGSDTTGTGVNNSSGIIETTPSTIKPNTLPSDTYTQDITHTITTTITQTLDTIHDSFTTSLTGLTQVATQISAPLAPVLKHVKEVIDKPKVEYANETALAPTMVVATLANATTSFGLGQLLVYLRFLFTQPFLLLRMRRRKHWGVVYNSFTKQPIDLAIIRLIDTDSGKIIETQVSDMQGRYVFIANPRIYRLDVRKTGFVGFSVHLKEQSEDTAYSDLYHGEDITLTPKLNSIAKNIPLDPDGVIVPTKKLLKKHTRNIVQTSLSSVSVVGALISFVISPTIFIAILLIVHVLVYVMFQYLSTQRLGKDFGTIFHQNKHKILRNTVIRIFDATYNRLVDTKISNTKGRYAALVGSGNYIVTYEKPSFEIKKTEVSISSRGKLGGVIARDEGLTKK